MANKGIPKFGGNDVYTTWRNKVVMWSLVTNIAKRNQAINVRLDAFIDNPKAEKAVSALKAEDLHRDGGLDVLLERLDHVFKADKVDNAYEAYSKFNSLSRKIDQSISDYILEFEHLQLRAKEFDMEYPETILTFKLLDGANLTKQEREMALTVGNDLNLEKMKSALKRIFASKGDTESSLNDSNEEEVYFAARSGGVRGKRFGTNARDNKYYNNTGSEHSGTTKSALNFVDRNGNVTRCRICESTMHWMSKCPHNPNNRKIKDINHINEIKEEGQAEDIDSDYDASESNVLFSGILDNDVFSVESVGTAIVDTACSRTVAGKEWLTHYMKGLDDKALTKINIQPSNHKFKFGDGRIVKAENKARIPCEIGKKKCEIDVELIEGKLPLLLSKQSLKRAKTILNLQNDSVKMFDQDIPVHLSSGGHYAINILPGILNEINLLEQTNNDKDMEKKILKLHRQFGHASKENLMKLIKNAGCKTKNICGIAAEVVKNCAVCRLYKKPAPRPAVGLPWANDFNKVIGMDLHQLDSNLYYIHMVDQFTKFSSAAIIKNKKPETIINAILRYWISFFGCPEKFLSDNGAEFNNETFRNFCENFGINPITTAAYSPFSNGTVERHNQTVTNMLLKVKEDTKCDYSTALCWAISAKNALINNNGYSPNMLVFGRNVNLPSIFNAKLPALEGNISCETVAKHLGALHGARKAFMQNENSNKIKKALKANVRNYDNFYDLEMDDSVFYKREHENMWRGPGKIIGLHDPIAFVRHGGQVIRVHKSRIQLVENKTTELENLNNGNIDEFISSQEDEQEDQDVIQEEVVNTTPSHTGSDGEHQVIIEKPTLTKFTPGTKIKFIIEDQEYEAEIANRAGKITGKYPNCYNIKYTLPESLIGKMGSVDLDRVETFSEVASRQNEDIFEIQDMDFSDAKAEELQAWKNNQVYREVENTGQEAISVRWVCSVKSTEQGQRLKARLVARGYEEENKISSDSPTCSKDGLRILLSISSQKDWKIHSVDIKTAFLQGGDIERTLYLKPPKEASTKNLWLLRKCPYGLRDASLSWYKNLASFMKNAKMRICRTDPAIFYYYKHDELQGIAGIHVDDIIFAGSDQFHTDVVKNLKKKFLIGAECNTAFKYLGLNLDQRKDAIYVNQLKYIDDLKFVDEKLRRSKEEIKNVLQSIVGQLLWVTTNSRPDCSFAVNKLASNIKNCDENDIKLANKVLKQLKNKAVSLKYENLAPENDLKLVVYSDASLGNLSDGSSQCGNLIFLKGRDRCNLIAWQSKKIRRIARSSLTAETLALSEALDYSVYINNMYSEILFNNKKRFKIEVKTDNKSLVDSLKSNKTVHEKRLRIEISMIKEMINKKQIHAVNWIKADCQLADSLTKIGASTSKLISTISQGKFV